MEPRKLGSSGCRRGRKHGRQNGRGRHRKQPSNPAWSETLACVEALCAGTGRSRVWPAEAYRGSASGRRGVEADDARTREVGLCHSSDEASEQSRATGGGAGGAKGGDQGERGPAKHAPGTEPGKCVTGAGLRAASRNDIRPVAKYSW